MHLARACYNVNTNGLSIYTISTPLCIHPYISVILAADLADRCPLEVSSSYRPIHLLVNAVGRN